jgi:LacI family transcriptional regulator
MNYGVSQRSIRRALARLAGEGRIAITPRKRPEAIADNTLETMIQGAIAVVMTCGFWAALNSMVHRPLMHGLARAAQDNDVPLLMLQHTMRWRTEFPGGLRKLPIGGIVLFGASFSISVLKQFETLRVPVVMLDRPGEEWNFHSVAVDNFSAAHSAASQLLKLGHRSIALIRNIVGDTVDPDDRERISGFRAALGTAPSGEIPHVQVFSATETNFEALALEIVNSATRFTAILTSSPRVAEALRTVCRRRGMRVPQDLSIVTFRGAERMETDWTGPMIDFSSMARKAVRMILQRPSEPDHLRVSAVWNPGETAAPPPRLTVRL